MPTGQLSNNSFIDSVPTPQNIVGGADLLRKGLLVAFPTETVYGLGGAAENLEAVTGIYATKGRPSHNPLIVHVQDLAMAERYGVFNALAYQLAEQFFPGPVTLVVPVKDGVLAPQLLAGGKTVALRCPAHPVAQALLQEFGAGIAAPSANRSGRVSPTKAEHVREEFAEHPGQLRMLLDGGATEIGLESTVVDCTRDAPVILRKGSVGTEAFPPPACGRGAGGGLLIGSTYMRQPPTYPPPACGGRYIADEQLKSPGLLTSHYAPNAPVRLNATDVHEGEALLAFGSAVPEALGTCLNLSPSGDLEEAAHHLYDYLRQLDALNPASIAVMPVPDRGIGTAINDRLQRAAAKR